MPLTQLRLVGPWMLAAVLVALWPPTAVRAQAVVQLPTIQQFSIGTTVMVPDGGTLNLGGVSRARESSVRRGIPGLPGQAGIGRELSSATVSVRATIIDLNELDRAVLAEARDAAMPLTAAEKRVREEARYFSRHVPDVPPAPAMGKETTGGDGGESLAELRKQRAQELAGQRAQAHAYLQRAVASEREGKLGVARIYFQMAARRAEAPLKQQIEAHLRELAKPPAPLAAASR